MIHDATRFVAVPDRDNLEPLLRRWRAAHPAVQVAGALSLGEIGSVHGVAYPLLHNATLVATRWPGADA